MNCFADRIILGAYHVALFPGWQSLAAEQCLRLRSSGLLSRTTKLLVGIVGPPDEDYASIADALGENAILRHLGPLTSYEFPTLQWLYEEAGQGEAACWYMHTKGVSSMNEAAREHRLLMESLIVDNHLACSELLDEYDACGTGWQSDGFGIHRPHFAGNFWWANSRYLRTLPRPSSLDLCDRYQAEFWIGSNPMMQPFELAFQSDPFSKPSAWVGLEKMYASLIAEIGEVKRIVDLGVDYGFSTFHFAEDFPQAEVIGVDDFALHDDAESWVRSHLNLFPNIKIIKGKTSDVGLKFDKPVDILHIDAGHDFESVVRDFCAWLHSVRPGGRVLFHDTVTFASVGAFFSGLGGRKFEIREHHGLGCWTKT